MAVIIWDDEGRLVCRQQQGAQNSTRDFGIELTVA